MPTFSQKNKKIAAASACAVALLAAAYQTWHAFHSHGHADATILLYDLERKALAEYPASTLPGDDHTAGLVAFAKNPNAPKLQAGMTLEDIEKAGLHAGWVYRLDADRKTGLYADPRKMDPWLKSGTPECKAQLNRWLDEAAAFSDTGRPIPCKD